jgi:hypothetical protein
MIWSAPFQILLSLIMLWDYLGAASLAGNHTFFFILFKFYLFIFLLINKYIIMVKGLATMILFIPVNIFLSRKVKILQASKLKAQDSRIK